MPLYIMYFNLKEDANEEEFVKKLKEYFDYLQGRVEGLGPSKLYKHHAFGANSRTYQMHAKFKDFGTWDRYVALNKEDAKFARLSLKWHNLINMNTRYDELVREIPVS